MYRIVHINVKTRERSFINGIFTRQECIIFITKHYIPGCGFIFSVQPVITKGK